MLPNTACSGRNELGTQAGLTIVQAKAWCQDNAACVSFEDFNGLAGYPAGYFSFSTSCTTSVDIPYTNIDIYVIDRAAAECTMVADTISIWSQTPTGSVANGGNNPTACKQGCLDNNDCYRANMGPSGCYLYSATPSTSAGWFQTGVSSQVGEQSWAKSCS
jgi:hypothetical protein